MASYFNKLTQDFQGLGFGGNDERPSSQYNSPPPANRDYGEYGYHGPNQGAPPPAQYYAAPPLPTYQPPSDKPPLPQGWIPLFDQSRQRWYYANEQTGYTQWEAPGYIPPRPPMETYPSSDSRTYGTPGYSSGAPSPYPPSVPYGPTPGSYNGPPGPPPSTGAYAGYDEKGSSSSKKKEKSGKGGMLLGAGAGIAAGLAGGALLHHALHDDSSSSSDEEERRYEEDRPQQTIIINNVTNVTEYNDREDSYYGYSSGAPGILPSRDVEGNYVSESDRESVQEARERYEEALAEAQDSSASSSDYEELAEAREEYYEEYEETYED